MRAKWIKLDLGPIYLADLALVSLQKSTAHITLHEERFCLNLNFAILLMPSSLNFISAFYHNFTNSAMIADDFQKSKLANILTRKLDHY